MAATLELLAPLDGWCMPLSATPDPVFSAGMMGDGISVDPTSTQVLAPFDCTVVSTPASGHAVSVRSQHGVEVLIHVGIDSVSLRGRGFSPRVTAGQQIRAGEPLILLDLDLIAQSVPSLVTPIIVTDPAGCSVILRRDPGPVRAGDVLLMLDAGSRRAAKAGDGDELSKAEAGTRIEERFQITLAHGLHARPAALIAQSLRGMDAEVEFVVGNRRADARSVVALMSLGVRSGEEITAVALGRDGGKALASVKRGLESALRHETGGAPGPAAGSDHSFGTPSKQRRAAPAGLEAVHAHTGSDASWESRESGDSSALTGSVASRGFAVGVAARLQMAEVVLAEQGGGVENERAALAEALRRVAARLERVAGLQSGPRRDIVAAHLEILADPGIDAAAQRYIHCGKSAGFAWRAALEESIARLAALEDERLRGRVDDLRDIQSQVLLELAGVEATLTAELPRHAVVIAEELLPSQLAALDRSRLAALCLARGGTTSHVAILAGAMGLPMLVGLGPQLMRVANGTPVIVDSARGRLELEPRPEVLAAALQRIERRAAESARLHEAAQLQARTADGSRIEVFANIGGRNDAEAAVRLGAEGCGLLRTEFLFLERSVAPDEEEQLAAYQHIADALGSRPLVLRLLDVGGDKPLSYLPLPAEANPALGLRGIRVGLSRIDLLRTQLRAALRVTGGTLRLLVPMVTDVTELRRVRALVQELASEIRRGAPIELGAMIETPAAAVTAAQLAAEADFLSIGSNDLTQYTLAIDRGHTALSAHIDALHPAVLSMIGLACAAAKQRPVAVCGAVAADPLAIALLLGLGVSELSVVPARIPQIKALVGRLKLPECIELAGKARALEDPTTVRALVRAWLDDREIPHGE
jgi:phosphocarrier protein FPr/phosphocarrier protein